MEQESFSLQVLIFMIILALYILASYFIDKRKITFLHQSTIVIFLGFLTALFLKYTIGREIKFSNELFFALLLPPIIFAVGYGIKKPYFFDNFAVITFLGVFSTMITIGLFACLLTLINKLILDVFTFKDILLISIIISSSDPITALPLIKNNHPKLNAVLSGESILNSAVVIILFGTITAFDASNPDSFQIIVGVVFNFTYLLFFSLLLGLVFGLFLCFIFKRVESFWHFPIKQTSLIILNSYLVYLIGQFLGLSGIIALFTTAVIFSIYGFQNLSIQARHGTILAFQTVKYISQAFIFAYLGASLLTIQGTSSALGSGLILILFMPVIRYLSISILPMIYKIMGRSYPLSSSERKMLWYSGLMRGVIAFALSLQIQSENRPYMITISLIVVMVTTILGSTLLRTFANYIGLTEIGLIKAGEFKEEENNIQLMPSTKYSIIGGLEQMKPEIKDEQQQFKSFEEKFIKPLFIKSQKEQKSIQNIKKYIQY